MIRTHRPTRRRRTLVATCAALLSCFVLAPLTSFAQDTERAQPRVDVVFVLDTTGSMAGLIEGAKAKIWEIANLIVSAEPTPDVRFGLIGYRDRGDAYVTQRFDLTDDIDAIYSSLMGFTADGGGDTPESVNQALTEAVHQMSWTPLSDEDETLRLIFLVGDAPPHMDYGNDTPYTQTASEAVAMGININPIQCGSVAGTQLVWQEIARAADGEYASIGQSGDVAIIATPFDDDLARLNREIGATVVGYGGAEEQARLRTYQTMSESAGAPAAADRLSFNMERGRVGGGGGDLVDAVENDEVNLADLDDEALPEPMRTMDSQERAAYIESQSTRRAELEAEVATLLEQRDEYLETERHRRLAEGESEGFDARVDGMIRTQAAEIGLTF